MNMIFYIDEEDAEYYGLKTGPFSLREIADMLLANRYDEVVVHFLANVLKKGVLASIPPAPAGGVQ